MKKHKLYDYKIIWQIREKINHISLKFNILKFKLRKKYLFEKEKLSVRKVYLLEIIKNVLVAFTYVILLYLIEYLSHSFYVINHNFFPVWLDKLISIIPKPTYPNNQDPVNGFVSLIASISGVLLALFYPILATIASSGYTKVNSSIRNLLFLEPITQNYLRRLAFLTAYSVCVLLFSTFGYYPGNLILILLSILSLFSLFNLLKIGAGVYSLFEPETLSKIAIKEIIDNIKSVTIDSIYWDNPSFQQFFRRKVEKNIEILMLLNTISIEGVTINRKSFLNTTSQTFRLLEYYLSIKGQIPLKSKWFRQKRLYKSYFETSSNDRELSTSTNTFIMPKSISNNFWLEEEIFEIYSEIGNKVALLKNQDICFNYLQNSVRILQYFGYSFEFDLADKLLHKNYIITKSSLIHNDKNTYENSKFNLMLIETMISLNLRDYHICFFDGVEAYTCDVFNAKIQDIDWDDKSSLYKVNLPYKLNPFFEEYFKYVKNEKYVEKKQITPVWYITQHITAEYLILIEKNFKKTLEQIERFALPLIKNCKENKNYLAVSFACHCSLELINKIKFRMPRIDGVFSQFDSNNFHKGSFTWTGLDIESADIKLNNLKEELIIEIADSMPKITFLKWDENDPDLFARSYAIISKEINNCFIEKDINKFKKIFPKFLKSSVSSFYFLYHDRYKNRFHHHLEIIYQIHIDLMQLSGLSYIYSELYSLPFWEDTIKFWDEISLDKSHIDLILSSYGFYKNSKFGTGINFIDNFNRKKDLFKSLEENKVDTKKYVDTIIRRFVSDKLHPNTDYEELFLEMYLFTFIDARDSIINSQALNRRTILFDIKRIYGK